LGITAKKRQVYLVLVFLLLGLGAATDPWSDCDRDRQNEQCYDQVIREDQSSVAVAYAEWRKSTIFYGKGDLEGALKAIDEAAKIDPQYAQFRAIYTPNEKTRAFTEANSSAHDTVQLYRNNTTALIYEGMELYERGMYDESIQSYDEAIELDPENITARFGMVLDFIENRQLSNITKTLDQIAELGFDDTVVWEDVAISLWQEHQLYEEAIRCFNRSIAIHNELIKQNSSNASAWNNKGVCLGLQADVDRDGYLYLTLNDDDASFSKSQAHARYREDKWNEALGCFEKATQLDPMCADAWYNKGMALYALNDGYESIEYYEETVHCFDQALRLQPRKECSRLIDTRYAEVAMRDKLMEMKMTPKDMDRVDAYA
jgi:tetratricopeptide (TPR) repeat protein